MADLEPITREELLLNSIAGEGSSEIEPITRQEHYLSAIAGESDLPADMKPITREEIYYQKILDNGGAGGGGEATGTKTINITANGTTSHNVKAYATAQIITNVPNPSTGTKQISQNGTHDVTDYASAQVDVPNSYESSDEGKVVSNGALASQTSRQVTANGTYDTTLNDEVVVNVPASGITPTGTKNITTNGDHDVTNFATAHVDVPTGITPSGSQEFTQNGTYDVTSLAEAVVNVEASGGASWTLLAEETASDDVTVMTITATEAMRGYTHYMIEVEGVGTGGNLYICPQLNSTTKKIYNGSSKNDASFHRKYYISPIYDESLNITYRSLAINNQSNAGSNAVSTINSFNVVSYSDTVYFKAGTTMKVWGISL